MGFKGLKESTVRQPCFLSRDIALVFKRWNRAIDLGAASK